VPILRVKIAQWQAIRHVSLEGREVCLNRGKPLLEHVEPMEGGNEALARLGQECTRLVANLENLDQDLCRDV
jgi:hypothetical protein